MSNYFEHGMTFEVLFFIGIKRYRTCVISVTQERACEQIKSVLPDSNGVVAYTVLAPFASSTLYRIDLEQDYTGREWQAGNLIMALNAGK